MKKSVLIFTVLLVIVLSAAPSFGIGANEQRNFSAEFVEKYGDTVREGKVYFSGEMSRHEFPSAGEILVTRRDKKVIWLIFPKERKYVESPYNFEYGEYYGPSVAGDDLKKEFVGHETIDTFWLKKYKVTVTYFAGEVRGEDSYYEWYRTDFPFPVKTESLDGSTSFEYRKIKFGEQSPSLFTEPKRYEKISESELADLKRERESGTESND